jgi:hypothetical protein
MQNNVTTLTTVSIVLPPVLFGSLPFRTLQGQGGGIQ